MEKTSHLDPLATAEPTIFRTRPDLRASVEQAAARGHARNTIRARNADWKAFLAWCRKHDVEALPADPATIAAYLTDIACTKATATVVRHGQTIAIAHIGQGFPSPLLHGGTARVMDGIKREKGTRQDGKSPFMDDQFEAALRALPDTMAGLRDRALLLFGLTTAMRREEIVAVTVADLRWVEQGVLVTLRRSKTDQKGEGRCVAVPYVTQNSNLCPAELLKKWLATSGIQSGPVFRGLRSNGKIRDRALNDREVARIVKRAAEAIGLDPDLFGGHSLRAGYVTMARKNGLEWTTIMEQTGHKQLATVKRYSRYTPEAFSASRVADAFTKKQPTEKP